MELRRLGTNGPLVSTIGMGCNNFSRVGTPTETIEGSTAVIHAAIDAGITFFDGADIYGATVGRSEEFMGHALRGHRDEVFLATKFGHQAYDAYPGLDLGPRGGERYIRHAVEQSLRRLGTDHLDLLQLHTPDPETPIAETLGVLNQLVAAGTVRYIGHSNFTADQAVEADAVSRDNGWAAFVSAQNEYSLLNRGAESELLPTASDLGLGFLPYFPLYNGLLTGKYSAEGGEGRISKLKPELLEGVDWERLEAYRALCDEAGLTMLEASIGWLLAQRPVTSVIAGATRPEQVHQNAAVTQLDADLADRISTLFGR